MKTRERPNKSHESGITLIALIIMIIILVILAAITIRGLTGNTGILETTQVAAEEYKIEEYKEQVTELRENAIAEYSIMGKEVTMYSIAERMSEEDTWIKTAKANLEQEDTNDDIIVTTIDGYMYQIYYDELTGQKFIEYVGKGEEESLPKIKATYNKGDAELTFTAKDGKGIAKDDVEMAFERHAKDGLVYSKSNISNRLYKVCMDKSNKYSSSTNSRSSKR